MGGVVQCRRFRRRIPRRHGQARIGRDSGPSFGRIRHRSGYRPSPGARMTPDVREAQRDAATSSDPSDARQGNGHRRSSLCIPCRSESDAACVAERTRWWDAAWPVARMQAREGSGADAFPTGRPVVQWGRGGAGGGCRFLFFGRHPGAACPRRASTTWSAGGCTPPSTRVVDGKPQ